MHIPEPEGVLPHLGHTLSHRHGCHSPGLGTGHSLLAFGTCKLNTPLWHLCGLAGACLSYQYYGLVAVQQVKESGPVLPHRKPDSFSVWENIKVLGYAICKAIN